MVEEDSPKIKIIYFQREIIEIWSHINMFLSFVFF